ncbi:hypothetical protein M501DRAFT_929972 [Patellaria atrata CBS 101060]|uniref:Secreted protein n=1 Tax=Patellaria atrata CBS 101060 TaxID=1346257 RepID=A0A9P4SEX7_9PEZI|nr:hypothetical protein M501DRAFT_929972 [Patellaria atrata CBS 101060]
MKLSIALVTLWLSMAFGQQAAECTKELIRTDDCAEVINANACYNKMRWRNRTPLQCIDGEDDADKARKACKCCSCVGTVMCNWASTNRLCTAS